MWLTNDWFISGKLCLDGTGFLVLNWKLGR
jgi:hypothetical protein